jgi:predicted ABC-type ATPase
LRSVYLVADNTAVNQDKPKLIVVTGPNGAGKSTAAPALLRDTFGILEYVNADVIARGLSAFRPEEAAIEAGRIMLIHLDHLAEERQSFAFESTLAGRAYAPWIGRLRGAGYEFHLFFVWLGSADLAVERVQERVRSGGHGIPADVVRRRYVNGLRNFFRLYSPLADTWAFYDNSSRGGPRLVAKGNGSQITEIHLPARWRKAHRNAK